MAVAIEETDQQLEEVSNAQDAGVLVFDWRKMTEQQQEQATVEAAKAKSVNVEPWKWREMSQEEKDVKTYTFVNSDRETTLEEKQSIIVEDASPHQQDYWRFNDDEYAIDAMYYAIMYSRANLEEE